MVDLYKEDPYLTVDFNEKQYVLSGAGKLGLIVVVDKDRADVYSRPTRSNVRELCTRYGFSFDRTIGVIDGAPSETTLLTINAEKYRAG